MHGIAVQAEKLFLPLLFAFLGRMHLPRETTEGWKMSNKEKPIQLLA
jgi:hypothetical protein